MDSERMDLVFWTPDGWLRISGLRVDGSGSLDSGRMALRGRRGRGAVGYFLLPSRLVRCRLEVGLELATLNVNLMSRRLSCRLDWLGGIRCRW